jgi:large subunit ribosomal protein L18
MKRTKTTRAARVRRHQRVRRRVSGTAIKPRLAVFRSLSHIYAQVIDDVDRRTLLSASDVDPAIRGQIDGKKKQEVATLVGNLIAERAKEQGIEQCVFDRGGFPFHGRVKALAEAARAGGLKF